MRCDIITLFPDLVGSVLNQSMLKRAQEKGHLEARIWNLRAFTLDRHQVADDVPYGGGGGMVLKAEPIFRAIDHLREAYGEEHPGTVLRLFLPSPQGRTFDQDLAEELRAAPQRLVFICGHYEGIDERVFAGLNCEEVSIGNYVLTGGELPTLVMIDAVARLIPGVLGGATSATQDSFTPDVLDFPHYTRPAEVRGMIVPEVLRSGNHDAIRRWRRKEALRNTYYKRPDLIQDHALGDHDRELLQDIIQDEIMHEGG